MIVRNTSTPEGRAFWESAKKSAEGVRDWPEWKKSGITVEQPGTPRDMKGIDQGQYSLLSRIHGQGMNPLGFVDPETMFFLHSNGLIDVSYASLAWGLTQSGIDAIYAFEEARDPGGHARRDWSPF